VSIEHREMEIEGRIVRAVLAGDQRAAQTLVLIHAFPFGARMWEPQLDDLEGRSSARARARWRLIAPSLPGFDGSDSTGPSTMQSYAQHVLAVLDHLNIVSAVVAGLSMGGYIAFELLRRAPQRVTGLVLADTRSGADTEEGRKARLQMINLAHERGPSAVAEDLIPKLLGPTTRNSRPHVVSAVRRLIEAQTGQVIADAAGALMTRPDSGPLLPTLRIPVCIIVGEEDGVTPPVESERMCEAIPGASLVRVPAAGHMTNLEAPAAFNDACARFLDALVS
jgi:pimeloyl-ACP methyl ester carboxylesterase